MQLGRDCFHARASLKQHVCISIDIINFNAIRPRYFANTNSTADAGSLWKNLLAGTTNILIHRGTNAEYVRTKNTS